MNRIESHTTSPASQGLDPDRRRLRVQTTQTGLGSSQTGVSSSALPLLSHTLTVPHPTESSGIDALAYRAIKRTLDLAFSCAFLILASPIMALIAFLIWREDRGPILYSQLRVGLDGKTFRFYKFRSMVRNADEMKADLATSNEADGPIFKMRQDPRITATGRILRKYSLDELPQFINVLRGEMSLVGPRPHLPSEVERWPGYPAERLRVLPGIACLREIRGRSNLTFEEWIELDLDYVRRRSLSLDLWILLNVIPAILRAEGAY